jgi:hypothetical protein
MMTTVMKRSLWIWATSWVAWLVIQHCGWFLNWNGLTLSNFNALCSMSRSELSLAVSPACQQASNWWGISTFAFWVGIGAAATFAIVVLRNRRPTTTTN